MKPNVIKTWMKIKVVGKKPQRIRSAVKKIPETCTRVFHITFINSGNVNEKQANEGWEKSMFRTEPNSALLSFMQVEVKFNYADVVFN